MKKSFLFLGLFCFASASLFGAQKFPKAKAILYDGTGQKVGEAKFSEAPTGVKIFLKVKKITPGTHAMHIHSVGLCQWPDFKSAGPHFNPSAKHHGLANPQGPHAGDMPNFEVFQNGKAKIDLILDSVTLGEGKNSLLQPGGTSLVIHASADDEMTDPAGNSGPRIACGVIQEDVH